MQIFDTEKEAKEFLKDVVGIEDLYSTIEKLKDEGYVKESLVEKANKKIDEYKSKVRNMSKYDDVVLYTKEDKELIYLLADTIDYLTSELEAYKVKE